jgi:light-regulated signal transduction histidine kinase (bacteriophytochrome)
MKLYVEKKVLGGFIITISILISPGVYADISHRALLSASREVSHLNHCEAEMSRRIWHADVAFISLLGTTVLILHRGKVNMDDFVKVLLTDRTDRKKRETLRVHVHTLPPAVADIGPIRQVWANLISNAIKYSRAKEFFQVWINAFETGTEIVYSIRDNGVGFDMQYVHTLFGVFQRLHRKDEFEGTGMGLAWVYRIVARQGGRVWAEAVPDQGATFFFSPPRTVNPNDR